EKENSSDASIRQPVAIQISRYEGDLPGNVTLWHPPYLTFTNHVYRLDALNRSRRGSERTKPLTRSRSSFYGAMILFHDVVQVPYGATATPLAQLTGALQLTNRCRVGRVPIHIDYARRAFANGS